MKQNTILEKIFKKISNYNKKNSIFVFFLICTLIIVWKLFSYTVLNYDFYRNLADKQQIWEVIVPVNRWTIYSEESNPTIIWTSLNLYDISVDPKSIWDKLKLTNYLTELVYKEICVNKKFDDCYNNILKFLHLVEIENFTNEENYVKKLIFEKLKEKIYQEKVTSVFIDKELSEAEINKIKMSWLNWLFIINEHLYINPEEISNPDSTIALLIDVLSYNEEDVKQLIRKKDLRFVSIINKISISVWEEIKKYLEEEAIAIKKWILNEENSIWNFIILNPMPQRFYPENGIASQIIWFVDNAWVWHYWIEWYFDDILKWNNWKIVSRKDVKWRIIDPIWLKSEDLVSEWIKINTTIDRNIQNKVEKILEDWVKEYKANRWSIVIMEPNTGRVLAMANYPTYDLNNYSDVYEIEKVKYSKYPNPKIDLLWYPVFVEDSQNWEKFFYDSKDIYLRESTREELWDIALVKYKYKNDFWPQVYKNDAISSLYEPWSIMKSITVAIWIDTWEITRYQMYQDDWEVKVWDFIIANVSHKCLWYHSFAHAVNYSCNVWMIRVAQKVWKVLLYQYLNEFWFSEKTWISLSNEVTASIRPRERWSLAQLLTSSFWLWISTTPLQMANAYSILANWWLYIKPRIIDSIEYPNWKKVEFKKELVRRVIKKSTSDTITSMLNSSITEWVANKWFIEWYNLAWKTWTSQIPFRWWYEEWVWSTIASFAWYWPIEDPKFVVIIKLDRPRVSVYGDATSAKLFKKTTQYLLDYYWIPKKVIN